MPDGIAIIFTGCSSGIGRSASTGTIPRPSRLPLAAPISRRPLPSMAGSRYCRPVRRTSRTVPACHRPRRQTESPSFTAAAWIVGFSTGVKRSVHCCAFLIPDRLQHSRPGALRRSSRYGPGSGGRRRLAERGRHGTSDPRQPPRDSRVASCRSPGAVALSCATAYRVRRRRWRGHWTSGRLSARPLLPGGGVGGCQPIYPVAQERGYGTIAKMLVQLWGYKLTLKIFQKTKPYIMIIQIPSSIPPRAGCVARAAAGATINAGRGRPCGHYSILSAVFLPVQPKGHGREFS